MASNARVGDLARLEIAYPTYAAIVGLAARRIISAMGMNATDAEWRELTPEQRRMLAFLLHAPRTRPQFVAYHFKDLPSPGPFIAKYLFGRPLLAWTVRTENDRRSASRVADQMIFEGFRP